MPADQLTDLRQSLRQLIEAVEAHLETRPADGREMALVRTKLQAARRWAVKAFEVRGA